MDHEDYLVMMIPHTYKPLLLVEEKAFLKIITHLDPSIKPITSSKSTRTLIPQKLKNS